MCPDKCRPIQAAPAAGLNFGHILCSRDGAPTALLAGAVLIREMLGPAGKSMTANTAGSLDVKVSAGPQCP